jgi:CRP-like cAMP-binding protein
MVQSIAPGRSPRSRHRLQSAVRETVKETARATAIRVMQVPTEARTDEHIRQLMRIVAKFSFFATLDATVTREVCRHLTLLQAEHSQVLCRQNEVGDCMYFVLDGAVHVVVRKGKEEERKVDSLKDGSCFGQLAIMADSEDDEGRRRTATCRASGPCVLLVLFRDDYQRLVAQAVHDAQNKIVTGMRTIRSLANAPRAELVKAAVMMRARPVNYPRGDVIAGEGTIPEALLFLSDGTAVVKARGGTVVRQVLVSSSGMEMVGARQLLHDEPFSSR